MNLKDISVTKELIDKNIPVKFNSSSDKLVNKPDKHVNLVFDLPLGKIINQTEVSSSVTIYDSNVDNTGDKHEHEAFINLLAKGMIIE